MAQVASTARSIAANRVLKNFGRRTMDDSKNLPPTKEALAQPEQEPKPFTTWLTCPNCNHKSPYSPIKAKTLEEEAVRLTAQAMQALSQMQRVPKYKASQIHPATDVIMVADLKRFGIKV